MIWLFVLLALGLPAIGYVLMVIDFRRYLRSLRRALVVVARLPSHAPYWTIVDRPPCLRALDLTPPITEEQVLAAYREKVKIQHPDRGGQMSDFLQLQQYFEQARQLARQTHSE